MAESENSETAKVDEINEPCQGALDLQKCMKDIVQKVLSNVSEEEFVQIYKNCYKEFEKKVEIEKPALSGSSIEAKKYQTQFNSMVVKSVFAALDQTVMSINQNLKDLKELEKEQEGSTVFWRPPGNASEHMVPFEYLCEMEIKTELEGKIRKEQENLACLKSRLAQKRTKAINCHNKLLKSISDIENEITKPKNSLEIKE